MDLEQARRGSANVITVFAQGAPVDNLQPDADHDLKKGLPGTNKTLSHARDFDEGAPSGTTASPHSVEALSAGTGAQEHGNAGFVASLEHAKEKQEESGSTAI
ncbi:MAG: hypothetical protein CYPHOPRED_002321 [Cyphobasidiales sp. Tagirdzhanova-0007]|nr:MAG: hypothetical protein CYPHOPRED_002321 [Cyphobasidiales sp. Tagirdzhanova-0007]